MFTTEVAFPAVQEERGLVWTLPCGLPLLASSTLPPVSCEGGCQVEAGGAGTVAVVTSLDHVSVVRMPTRSFLAKMSHGPMCGLEPSPSGLPGSSSSVSFAGASSSPQALSVEVPPGPPGILFFFLYSLSHDCTLSCGFKCPLCAGAARTSFLNSHIQLPPQCFSLEISRTSGT